jgi:biotin transport system substrate-specific component
MSEEALIPKMTRIDKQKRPVKIPLINFVVIIFCTLLIIASTFININLKHYIIPMDLFTNKNLVMDNFIFCIPFIPQIPIVMFICSVLGRRMALTSVILYIIIGLFFCPVFALGGGIKYFGEYGFGYILAYIPALLVAGKLLDKYSFLDMIKASLAGVFTIHICGVLYMILVALVKNSGSMFILGWITAQSGLKIVYDLIASFVLILIGKYLHEGLKFILK